MVVGLIWASWVHWGAPWRSFGSSEIAGFVGVCPGGRQVQQGSLVSLGCALGVVRFIRASWVHWRAPWVLPGSSGATAFIRVRLGVRRVHLG